MLAVVLSELQVELGARAYPIVIGTGLLDDPALLTGGVQRPRKVITDSNVAPHYLARCLRTLQLRDEDAYIIPAGETQKNWDNLEAVLDWLLAARFPRDGELVALGGGVVGDLTGFCAAIYQRGVDFLQIPTTLLSQVDSSVGGKTGVNHARGKNMIGAFHQPRRVVASLDTLSTLPPRELSAGLAEIIKTAMLADAALFAELEAQIETLRALDVQALAAIIERCCRIKARIVGLDEREAISGGPRALLNLGHTFGHAVETYTHYQTWLHGEAVGLGLCMASSMSAHLGWLDAETDARCQRLIARAGLPGRPPEGMCPADFMNLMARDKKVAAGSLRLILMRGLGDAVLSADFAPDALAMTLAQYCQPAAAA